MSGLLLICIGLTIACGWFLFLEVLFALAYWEDARDELEEFDGLLTFFGKVMVIAKMLFDTGVLLALCYITWCLW